jgi:hypothetical protein
MVRAAGIVALAAGFLMSSGSAWAEDDPRHIGWLPSISVGFNAYNEKPTGEVGPPPGEPWADVDKEPDTVTAFRFAAELMTPRVTPKSVGDFRLFTAGGVSIFADQEKIASEEGDRVRSGQPEADLRNRQATHDARVVRYYADPDCAPVATSSCNVTFPPFPVDNITAGRGFRGQRSEVSALHHNPAWWAQVGFAYSMPWNDFLVRVKPSVEYFGEKIRVKGRHVNVVDEFPGPTPSDPQGVARTFILNRRRGAETQIFHNLGPSLELEAVVKDTGLVTISVFGDVKYLWSVGDRELTFRDDNVGVVQFKYRRTAGQVRGGLGIRVGWRGWN